MDGLQWYPRCIVIEAEDRAVARVKVTRRFTWVGLMMLATTCAVGAPRADVRESPAITASAMTLPAGAGPSHAAQPDTDADNDEGVTDLYGNDVTSAVANYKLDVDGSLYEAHSPQTQLPRLGSPKS
jgi:hypothetical protein